MENIKEYIEEEIRSFERSRNDAAKEVLKNEMIRQCHNEFVGVLKLILDKIEEADNENS